MKRSWRRIRKYITHITINIYLYIYWRIPFAKRVFANKKSEHDSAWILSHTHIYLSPQVILKYYFIHHTLLIQAYTNGRPFVGNSCFNMAKMGCPRNIYLILIIPVYFTYKGYIYDLYLSSLFQ